MSKENKVGTYLRNRLYDVVDLAGDIGLVGIIDYLGGFSIDHPMGDIAVGAGLQAGDATSSGKTSRLVSSVLAAGLSMCPDFAQLVASGDAETFLKGAGVKAIGYGAGALIGGFMSESVKRNYDGMIEVNALFKNEVEANQAHEYLKGIAKVGGYVRGSDSSVDEPQQTEKGYSLHARIIGKTPRMQEYLRPSLETYFSRTMEPLEAKVSDVVKVRGK